MLPLGRAQASRLHRRLRPAVGRRRHHPAVSRSGPHGGNSSATVTRRYRTLHQFYGWLDRRGEVSGSPMASVGRPDDTYRRDVLTPGELAAVLGACRAPSANSRRGRNRMFEVHRDTAILLVLITTGMTASELTEIRVDDVDLDAGSIRVVGRGGRVRLVQLLRSPNDALQRYFSVRDCLPHASDSGSLWLGERGAFTTSGLRQMLVRRSAQAGIRPVTAGDFRRTFAHDALGRGTSKAVVAHVGGWGSASTVARYRPR